MREKPIVIVFVGNVGAGKSTHISLAFNELRKRGVKARKVYVKTLFIITPLLGKLQIPGRASWRISVALDLLLNGIYLPLLAWVKTILVPVVKNEEVVLVEEHLVGSLVDYFHAAAILSLVPLVRHIIRFLAKISRICGWQAIVYLQVDKSLLKDRWEKRGSPDESKAYLLAQDVVFKIASKHSENVVYINTARSLESNVHSVLNFILGVVKRYEASYHSSI
jgi:ribose 1,5-bisphosphokinase PhnN